MSSGDGQRSAEAQKLLTFSEIEFFVCSLERFAEDRFKPVRYFSLAVFKVGDVLDKGRTSAGGKILFHLQNASGSFQC